MFGGDSSRYTAATTYDWRLGFGEFRLLLVFFHVYEDRALGVRWRSADLS